MLRRGSKYGVGHQSLTALIFLYVHRVEISISTLTYNDIFGENGGVAKLQEEEVQGKLLRFCDRTLWTKETLTPMPNVLWSIRH